MRNKIFNKYFITIAAIVLISLTAMMMILTVMYNSFLAVTKYEMLQNSCDSVAEFVKSDVPITSGNESKRGAHYVMRNMANVSDYNMYITDMNGMILICSCDEWGKEGFCEHTSLNLSRKFVDSIHNEDYVGLNTMGIYKNPHYVATTKLVVEDSKVIGYIIAAAPMTAVKELMSRVVKIYLISAIIPTLVLFVALYLVTYRMIKPLRLMSQAAKAMAKGDFSKRIPVTSDDEVGQLAVSFNKMTNSLSRLEDMRKSFVADISHELKTPMTTISGFIDGIIDGTIERDKQGEYLEIVSSEVKRLSRMVESMLSLSKIESGEFVIKPEKFNFKELLLNIVISQERSIEQRGIDIEGLDTIPDVTIDADRDLIYRVVYNLVDNAIKFAGDSGYIKFKLDVDSKQMVFCIKNSGKGIPAGDLPYVFERFYKVDKSRSNNRNSMGLGLYIVKTIVKNHNGSISVSSKENEFTAFTITLPLFR